MADLLKLLRRKAAKIDLSFLGGVLPARVAYSCASGQRSYFDKSGIMRYAAANEPRFDYDPITHAPRGILIEGARTNYTKKSYPMIDTLDWWGTAATTILSEKKAPDGVSNFLKLFDNEINSTHMLFASSKVYEQEKNYTFSCYAAAGSHDMLQIIGGSAPFGTLFFATFDLKTGLIAEVGPATQNCGIIPCGNGVYRCFATGRATGGTGVTNAFCLTNNMIGQGRAPAYVGGGNFVYISGAQVEEGSTLTSHIVTAGAVTTRAADQMALSLPPQIKKITYIFSDDSTQEVGVTAGAYVVPTNLLGTRIKRIKGV